MTESNDRDPIGSVADEARKLFESIQGRATRHVGKSVLNSFTGGGRREQNVWEEAVSDHDEYICRACPLCRAIAARRESGSDVTGHLMAAGGELFAAVREALDTLTKPAPGARRRERQPREDHPNVEHIDLG